LAFSECRCFTHIGIWVYKFKIFLDLGEFEYRMKILGYIFLAVAFWNLMMCYLVGIDKIQPSKSSQIANYIIISILLLGYAIRVFLG
jgi:uncharacterized membrane protein YwzB